MLLRHITSKPSVRTNGLQAFSDYRRNETGRVAGWDGLVEYETLELRLNPPQIEVDNTLYDDLTVLTIDSANRSGTLAEVAMCLAELDLLIRRARISSDGGWFIDEFHVTENPRGRVLDPRKIAAIKKSLDIVEEPVASSPKSGDTKPGCSVFELAGAGHDGLLAAVIQLMAANGCNIKFSMVWSLEDRCAIVLGANEAGGGSILDEEKLQRLQQTMTNMLGSVDVVVRHEQVLGTAHQERRLHKLMMLEELRLWKKQQAKQSVTQTQSALTAMIKTGEGNLPDSSNMVMKESSQGGLSSSETSQADESGNLLKALKTTGGGGSDDGATCKTQFASLDDLSSSLPVVCIGDLARSHSTPPSNDGKGLVEDPDTSCNQSTRCCYPFVDHAPEVDIKYSTCLNYLLVTMRCKDRPKLFIDTVSIFLDLDYDVYHGAVDTGIVGDHASLFFYIRPRYGECMEGHADSEQLQYLLEAACSRRHVDGMKMRIRAWDKSHLMESLLSLGRAGMSIRRAEGVSSGPALSYTLSVSNSDGCSPAVQQVAKIFESIGGMLMSSPDAGYVLSGPPMNPSTGHGAAFCFSFLDQMTPPACSI